MQVFSRPLRLLNFAQLFRQGTLDSQWQQRMFAAASSQMEAIKSLRESTSAPILDVKKALVEASWNVGVP